MCKRHARVSRPGGKIERARRKMVDGAARASGSTDNPEAAPEGRPFGLQGRNFDQLAIEGEEERLLATSPGGGGGI